MLHEVKNVQLRAANINTYEEPSAVWLVPAWIFDLNRSVSSKIAEQSQEYKTEIDTVVLNVIDGDM